MPDAGVTLEPVDEKTLADVETVLEKNDLPTADVQSKPESFFVGFAAGERIGIGGLERFDTVGLLRSLVVEESVRGEGYGTDLCEALETRASADGVQRLYLLTTTAAGFFDDRGYRAIERTAPPAPIRQTTEFTTLCPETAVCMTKRI
jgi:amino-acid N-acetyltransferase